MSNKINKEKNIFEKLILSKKNSLNDLINSVEEQENASLFKNIKTKHKKFFKK